MMLWLVTLPNPLGFLLMWTIARRNLKAIAEARVAARQAGENEAVKSLDAMESDLKMNTQKQGMVLTTALALAYWYVDSVGAPVAFNSQHLQTLAGGLTVAWFVITFASVKKDFLDSAVVLTYLMFTAFSVPWMVMVIAALSQPELYFPLAAQVLIVVVIVFAWTAAAIYDSLDLLRGNMDEVAIEFFVRATQGKLDVRLATSDSDDGGDD